MTLDEAALRKVLEMISDQVLVVDRTKTVRYLNRARFGYEVEYFIGKTPDQLLAPGSVTVFNEAFKILLETGEPQENELEVALPDGFRRWFRMELLPFQEDGVLVIIHDIQELKEAQEEAAELRKLLPLCSWCGSIQTEEGEWVTMEEYLSGEKDTSVSHGLCPDCSDRLVSGAGPAGGSNRNAG